MTNEQFSRIEALLAHIADLLHNVVYLGEHQIYESPDRTKDCRVCNDRESSEGRKE